MLQELYLVRHAQPNRNTTIRYDVEPGPPLTAQGEDEARQAATWLDDRGIEYIYSSPFLRTSATADTIVEKLGIPISYVTALGEFTHGETQEKVRERVAAFLDEVKQLPLRSVAFVSHGMCIKMLLLHTTQDKINLSQHVYDYGNCSPTAGIWHGQLGTEGWTWELVFQPQQNTAPNKTNVL